MRELVWTSMVNSPSKTFLGLIIAASLICFLPTNPLGTPRISLEGKQLVLGKTQPQYVVWNNRHLPELCRFTVCLDLNQTEEKFGTWSAFSYHVDDDSWDVGKAELALFASDQSLQISLMGGTHALDTTLLPHKMYQVCLVWDSRKGMLEIFNDGRRMDDIALGAFTNRCLRPNGTLVLGHFDARLRFDGILHYFQMWDFVREQQDLLSCQPPGNVVSWQRNFWVLNGVTVTSARHQRCGEEEMTSKAPSCTTREPHPSGPADTSAMPGTVPPPFTESARLTWGTPGASVSSGITTKATQSVLASEATLSSSTTAHGETTPHPSHSVSTQPTSAASVPFAEVTFYNVQMNFTVTSKGPNTFDSYDVKKISIDWFAKAFKNSTFVLVQHNFKRNGQPRAKIPPRELQRKAEVKGIAMVAKKGCAMARSFPLKMKDVRASQSYSSKSIVKARSNLAKEEIVNKLEVIMHGGLTDDALSMTVDRDDVDIVYFDPGNCQQETTWSKYKGSYPWPQAAPDTVEHQTCDKNKNQLASRECSIKINLGHAYWKRQNLTACPLLIDLPDNIMGLQNVDITPENADEVADHILGLLNMPALTVGEVDVLVEKLSEIADCEEVSVTLARKVMQVINIFIRMGPNAEGLQKQANRILTIMEQVGFKMDFSGREESIVFPKVAMTSMRPDRAAFQGVAFGVMSYDPEKNLEIDIRQVPFQGALASIFLPEILKNYLKAQSFEPEDHMGIQFSFLDTTVLFMDTSLKDATLNTYVVGASIENVSVQNLQEPVNIILQHIEKNMDGKPLCVFWDFAKNGGQGGWNASGCQTKHTDANYTTCVCSHLTHFGVLLDISRSPINGRDDQILTWFSYLGCGTSSIFLGLSLVVHLSIDKLRMDYPSKIFINLCLALLLLNFVFLLNQWLASFSIQGLCVAVAVVLHYSLLAAFTWMGLEAVHMYYALVKVFNTHFPNYMLKFSIAGWGIPAVIVAVVLAINTNFYGTEIVSKSNSSSSEFCWIQNSVVFYISVLGYFCVMFFLNTAMFVTVLLQIRAVKAKNPRQQHKWSHTFLHDLKRVGSLMVLLGLTWGFAFFAWGPVRTFFMYLFAICNTLQGLFIFVFHCLMKDNVRKQCQIHFCCGKFQLGVSDWSRSSTNLGYHYPSRDLERKPSVHSLRSCATVTTSNGSGSLPGNGLDTNAEGDQVLCIDSLELLTRKKVKFPHARISSPVMVELQ